MLFSANTLLQKLSNQTLVAAFLGLPLMGSAQTIAGFTPSSGPTGTSVLITDTNLAGTTQRISRN